MHIERAGCSRRIQIVSGILPAQHGRGLPVYDVYVSTFRVDEVTSDVLECMLVRFGMSGVGDVVGAVAQGGLQTFRLSSP